MNVEQKLRKWLDNLPKNKKTELYNIIKKADESHKMQQSNGERIDLELSECSCFSYAYAYSNTCVVHTIKNLMNKDFNKLGDLEFFKSHFDENIKFEKIIIEEHFDEKELKTSKWCKNK